MNSAHLESAAQLLALAMEMPLLKGLQQESAKGFRLARAKEFHPRPQRVQLAKSLAAKR
jgi:hypothetical protein